MSSYWSPKINVDYRTSTQIFSQLTQESNLTVYQGKNVCPVDQGGRNTCPVDQGGGNTCPVDQGGRKFMPSGLRWGKYTPSGSRRGKYMLSGSRWKIYVQWIKVGENLYPVYQGEKNICPVDQSGKCMPSGSRWKYLPRGSKREKCVYQPVWII